MLKISLLHISQVLTSKSSFSNRSVGLPSKRYEFSGRRHKHEYGYSNSLNNGNFEDFFIELTSEVGSQPIDGAEKHITALFYFVNQCSILLLSAVAWLTSDPVISYMIPMVNLKVDIFAFE